MHLPKALFLAAALTAHLVAQSPAAPVPAPAPAPPAPPSILGFALTGSSTIGSQYIFRGLTQTDGKPTVQAELDLVHPSGFYLSTSLSNISWITDQFSAGPVSAGVEVDLFGGYKWAFAKDWALDLGVYRYFYPGDYKSLSGYDPNTTEAYLGLSYSWASLKYSRVISSGNFGIADAEGSSYVDLSLAYPLGESGWTVLAHGGKTTFNTSNSSTNTLLGYTDYKLGIAKEIKGYTLALAGTNADTKDLGYNNAMGRNIGKGRVTFTITKAF
jgi:uncharacterized protein (TIGR02001 family)